MKKKLSFWGNIAVFTLCVALVIAASFYALSVRQLNVVYTPADSKESTADITNPFCGFYKINGYVLAEDKTARDADIWCQRMILCQEKVQIKNDFFPSCQHT